MSLRTLPVSLEEAFSLVTDESAPRMLSRAFGVATIKGNSGSMKSPADCTFESSYLLNSLEGGTGMKKSQVVEKRQLIPLPITLN